MIFYLLALVMKFPPTYGTAYGKPYRPEDISKDEFLKGLALKRKLFLFTNVKYCRI